MRELIKMNGFLTFLTVVIIIAGCIYGIVYFFKWRETAIIKSEREELQQLREKMKNAIAYIQHLEQQLRDRPEPAQVKNDETSKKTIKTKKNENHLNEIEEELFIVGVTFKNDDRTERQNILQKCRNGDEIRLIRTPMKKYPNAIGVFTRFGQIGNISEDENEELAKYLDNGGLIENARIHKLTGGQPNKPTIGCVIRFSHYMRYEL